MLREWRTALRALAQRRALTAAIVATLTVSIGATSAVFSALDTVVLAPLPYPGAERLVAIFETNASLQQSESGVAAVRLDEWNRLTSSFEAVGGSYFENMTDTTGPVAERLASMRTSPRFFAVLGTSAALGRTFTPDEERFGGPPAMVLSDPLWRSRFGADSSIVGRSLTLGGVSRVVVGVMPPSFRYPTAATEAWIPAQAHPGMLSQRLARFYTGIGRLKPGITLEQAQHDVAAVQARVGQQFPGTDEGWSVRLAPLKDEQIGGVRRTLWLLFGAVLLVLLASCGNIAGLLLADATRRESQVAVQLALGASRGTIVRQRLFEGALLSLAGSCGGLVLGYWGIEAIRALATRLPRAAELQMDTRLIAFTIAAGALATVGFALFPAIQATRLDVMSRLGGRGPVSGRQHLQRALVMAQVAFAVVLLVGAGLLVRTFVRFQQTSPGFDATHVVAFRMSASWSERPEAVVNRQHRTLERLAAMPGASGAAMVNALPSGPWDYPPSAFTFAGRPREDDQVAVARQVTSTYFKVLRIPVLEGHTCSDDPRVDAPQTLLVNQAFAVRFFPNDSPIGHQLAGRARPEIIGIVGNAREQSLLKEPAPSTYRCGLMAFYPDPWFLVRFDPARPVSMTDIRAAMRDVEPQRAVYAAGMLDDLAAESASEPRLNTILFVCFAATAVMLVAVGLYGLLTQFVSERTREIGLRLALGARPAQVLAQVFRQSAGLTAGGIVVGLIIATVVARVMASVMYGIAPGDPLTFVAVPLVVGLVTVSVTLLPARRAASLDPLVALRQE